MKKNFWYRAGPALAAAGLAWAAGGCQKDRELDLGLTPATTSGAYATPLDSVPDSTGATFYFLAVDTQSADLVPGIFRVPAAGGPAAKLASGAPLASPLGIAVSEDDKMLFIADRTAGADPQDDVNDSPGGIYSLPIGGGTPALLPGTLGFGPRALHVSRGQIFFTGAHSGGAPGVFQVGVGGGTPVAVVQGPPLQDPSGITVLGSGDIYVADSVGATDHTNLSSIFKVSGGSASELLRGLQVGFPAGIAATLDDSTLLVSGQDQTTGTSVVHTISISSQKVTSFNKGIESSQDSGGLHRAQHQDLLSWCGVTVGDRGTVFQVKLN